MITALWITLTAFAFITGMILGAILVVVVFLRGDGWDDL